MGGRRHRVHYTDSSLQYIFQLFLWENCVISKIRIFLTSSNISLNDILLIGPVIQGEFVYIIVRSRSYKFILTTDIENVPFTNTIGS